MKTIRNLWRRPFIEFADDNAFVNRAWWKRFLPELATRHVRWFAETDLSVEDLRHGFYDLAGRLYSDSFTRHRKDAFRHRHLHRALVE